MTAMATEPQGRARVKPAAGKTPPVKAPPGPQPPTAPRGRRVPLTPMRQQAAKSMRKLAQHIQADHPELAVHKHLQDAARTLESGNEEGAQRHLRAAFFALEPRSLHRQGVHDDEGHISARQAVHGVHRHLLLVKDIQDVAEKNQAAIRRDSYGDDASSSPLPQSPLHADPNAGYGPGALAQKPTQRQPGGDRALNAPDRTNSGGSDPAVADPVGRQPKGSKQFSYGWDDLAVVVGLAAVTELSAQTARLAVTPAPRGKPGGPGLYDVKGMGHTAYEQQIVKALIEKRGMPPGKAYAIARGAIRRWSRGGGKVHPEVRAAAGAAEAGELQKQARAKAMHGHANSRDGAAVELARPHGYVHGWIKVGSGERSAAGAAKYHGVDGIRGDTGNGVVVGRYNHQAKTVTDRNGVKHAVKAIDPTAHEAGYKGGRHLPPDVLKSLDSYDQAFKTGAVTRRLKKQYAGIPGGSGVNFSWDDVARVVELVGPHGYIHGWIKVGSAAHSDLERGMNPTQASTVTSELDKAHAASTAGKHDAAHTHLNNALNRARYFSGSSASLQSVIRSARTLEQNKAKAEKAIRPASELATVRGWDGVALELASVLEFFNPAQPRVPPGSGTAGQFAPPGGAQQQQKQTPAQQKAAKKAALLKQAKADRAKAAGILKQITALQKIVSAAQKATGKTKKASANVTKSNTPAKKTAAAPAAGTPAAAAATAAKTATSAAKTAGGAAKAPTASQAAKQLTGLRAQYKQLMTAAAQATAQAAKL